MASTMMKAHSQMGRMARSGAAARPVRACRGLVRVQAAAASDDLGFKTMRSGVKEAADESILTPRFYTT
jgi:magnesium-protoporphyrin IX monomethyl ester (oxidative) cyclase